MTTFIAAADAEARAGSESQRWRDYTGRTQNPRGVPASMTWAVAFPLNRDEPYRIYECACHEGNHALANMLRLGDRQNPR